MRAAIPQVTRLAAAIPALVAAVLVPKAALAAVPVELKVAQAPRAVPAAVLVPKAALAAKLALVAVLVEQATQLVASLHNDRKRLRIDMAA